MTRPPSSPRTHARLACAIAAAMAASAAPVSTANDTNDWIRFRNDPAQRLFPALPGPRTAAPPTSPAATWPVTNCNDDGAGSLRAAVAGATSGDTIDLGALTCSTITLTTGAIAVEMDSLTLEGPGRNLLAIDGNQLDRVLVHPYGGTLQVRGLTVRNGRISAEDFDVTGGGCIASAGYVLLQRSTARDCTAVAIGSYGGGIYAYALALQDSILSSNHALGTHAASGTAAFGGGAFVYQMMIQDSTVSGNRADHAFDSPLGNYDIGGGIITVRGGSISGSTIDGNFVDGRGGGIATFTSMSVSNSTLSANVAAAGGGGALFVRRPATLDIGNSTISTNISRDGGGGIWVGGAGAYLHSTIVYGNQGGNGPADIEDPYPLTISGHANLVGTAGALVALPGDTVSVDPGLGPLQHNGGTTRTHALGPGSPAIDAGSNLANLPNDQRGGPFARIHGTAADIGAYERQAEVTGVPATPVPALSTWFTGLLALLAAALAAWRMPAARRARP